MSNLLKKEKGFTLIEIVLVLAIAGLLLVIVFLAVSGAQKSRRDSQRKNDLSRLESQIESYASNTNGLFPGNTGALSWGAFTSSTYVPSNFNDPSTGTAYLSITSGPGTVTYTLGGTACDGTALSGRQFKLQMTLEQGVACRDNK